MENPAAKNEPIILHSPTAHPDLGKKQTSSNKTPLLVGIILVTLFLVVGFVAFIMFNKPKQNTPRETKTATTSTSSANKVNSNIGYVTALEGLNLRDKPSTDANIILLLPEATRVTILGSDGDWYYVEAQTKGYVSKEFISSQKPEKPALIVFNDQSSPFNFLYHDVYKLDFKKIDDSNFEYNFTSSDSFGGFSVSTEKGFTTLGNYALKNYPQATKTACQVQFAASRKECEQLQTDNGTLYLLLINTTLYKIAYLKTEGGALADINNIVFYTLFFKDQSQ